MSQQKPQQQSKQVQRVAITKFPVEIGTRMIVSIDDLVNTDERIAADFIGVVHFEYLILRLPWVPGIRTRLVNGITVTVRLVSNGELCGFHAPIIAHTVNPALIVFLEYPSTIEKLALRQHKRFRCILPVQLHSPHGNAKGVIIDMSRSGCRVAVDTGDCQALRQTVLEDKLTLLAPLTHDGVLTSASCTVRNVSSESDQLQLGLSFTETDKKFWDVLDAFLGTVEE